VPLVLRIFANGFVISSLPPLVFSLLSFSLSCRLFSIVYSLFAQNKGVGVPRQQWDSHFCLLAAVGAVLRGFTGRSDITIRRQSDDF